MKPALPSWIGLALAIPFAWGIPAASAQEGKDARMKRVLDRIEKVLRESHARLIEDVERIVREEVRKARAAAPKDPAAELAAFAEKLRDDGGLDSRLKKFLGTGEGRKAVLREMEERQFRSVGEMAEHFCRRGPDGRYSVRPERAQEVQEWLEGTVPEAPPAGPAKRAYLGISAGDLTDPERKALGIGGGIRIAEVRGPAERAGLRPGDILLAIGGAPVTEETIARTLARHRPGDEVEVTVLRGRRKETFNLVLGERGD